MIIKIPIVLKKQKSQRVSDQSTEGSCIKFERPEFNANASDEADSNTVNYIQPLHCLMSCRRSIQRKFLKFRVNFSACVTQGMTSIKVIKFVKAECKSSGTLCTNPFCRVRSVSRYQTFLDFGCDLQKTINRLHVSLNFKTICSILIFPNEDRP